MVPQFGVLFEIDLGPLAPHYLSEIIAGLILLAVVWFICARFVVPAFEKMYAERSDRIEGGIQRAAEAEARAEEALAEYQRQLNSAREEAARIREDAKNSGAQMIAEARDRATAESERILQSGRAQLQAEREQLVTELRGEVGGLATQLAEKIVGESLSDDERAGRTIDRFIADLEASAR